MPTTLKYLNCKKYTHEYFNKRKNACRLCWKITDSSNLLQNDVVMAQFIVEYIGLNVKGHILQTVCNFCASTIKSIIDFKKFCLKTDLKLSNILANGSQLEPQKKFKDHYCNPKILKREADIELKLLEIAVCKEDFQLGKYTSLDADEEDSSGKKSKKESHAKLKSIKKESIANSKKTLKVDNNHQQKQVKLEFSKIKREANAEDDIADNKEGFRRQVNEDDDINVDDIFEENDTGIETEQQLNDVKESTSKLPTNKKKNLQVDSSRFYKTNLLKNKLNSMLTKTLGHKVTKRKEYKKYVSKVKYKLNQGELRQSGLQKPPCKACILEKQKKQAPKTCRLCDKVFKNWEEYKGHLKTCTKEKLHEPKPQKKFTRTCRLCHETFEVEVEFYKHIKNCIEERQKCHACEKSEIFNTAEELNNHKKKYHPQDLMNICEVCGKLFKKDYNRHMRIHRNERVQCKLCDKSYHFEENLDAHVRRVHMNERRFACDMCPYRCNTRLALKVHYVKHTGARDYKCKLCENCYATNKSLQKHIELVHEGLVKQHECPHCLLRYNRVHQLQKHMFQKHGIKIKTYKGRYVPENEGNNQKDNCN